MTISSLGIVSIDQNTGSRIETLEKVADQAAALDAWRGITDPKIQALLSTVSAIR